MAPEQARSDGKELSARTDNWALGVMLYELLVGQPPFEGTGAALLKLIETADAPSMRARRRMVSRDLEAVCFKCLVKDPRGRYASAGELAADSRRVLAEEPTLARPAARWRGIRWARRHLPAAAVMILVLTTTGLAIMPARRPDQSNDASARNPRAKLANTVYVQNKRDAIAAWTTKGQECRAGPNSQPVILRRRRAALRRTS